MKVLFAVSNDNITTSVVNKYQQKYKEIVTTKSVYYFNAIIKELQRNKSYDRVVISEDLEEFTSSSFEQKDIGSNTSNKFIDTLSLSNPYCVLMNAD